MMYYEFANKFWNQITVGFVFSIEFGFIGGKR